MTAAEIAAALDEKFGPRVTSKKLDAVGFDPFVTVEPADLVEVCRFLFLQINPCQLRLSLRVEDDNFTFGGKTKPVLCLGDAGPAVIVIHEVFGFTPPLARFCRWMRAL